MLTSAASSPRYLYVVDQETTATPTILGFTVPVSSQNSVYAPTGPITPTASTSITTVGGRTVATGNQRRRYPQRYRHLSRRKLRLCDRPGPEPCLRLRPRSGWNPHPHGSQPVQHRPLPPSTSPSIPAASTSTPPTTAPAPSLPSPSTPPPEPSRPPPDRPPSPSAPGPPASPSRTPAASISTPPTRSTTASPASSSTPTTAASPPSRTPPSPPAACPPASLQSPTAPTPPSPSTTNSTRDRILTEPRLSGGAHLLEPHGRQSPSTPHHPTQPEPQPCRLLSMTGQAQRP